MTWSAISGRELLERGPAIWAAASSSLRVFNPVLSDKFVGAALELTEVKCGSVLLLYAGSSAAPTCALFLKRSALGIWQSVFSPHLPISLVCSGGISEVHTATLMAELFSKLPGLAWAIKLLRIDSDYSPRLAGTCDLPIEVMPIHKTMRVDVEGSFAQYWSARSKSLRRSVAGTLSRLSSAGIEPRLVCVSDAAGLAKSVVEHGRLEDTGWKGVEGTSLGGSLGETEFYQRLLRVFGDQGMATAFQLYFGSELVASQITLCEGGTQVLLKTAYRGDLSKFAPGRVLDYFMLRQVFSDGSTERIEYCTNASEDDVRWATSVRDICQINIFRNSALGWLTGQHRAVKRRLCGGEARPTGLPLQAIAPRGSSQSAGG